MQMIEIKKSISDILSPREFTLRRLPIYLSYLEMLWTRDQKLFSATELAKASGVYHTQVRKDLSVAGLTGKPRVGHQVQAAIDTIREYLGWQAELSAVVIGAGNMASALIANQDLKASGLKIVAAFDNKLSKINSIIRGVPVHSLSNLNRICQSGNISLGIITTPDAVAQAAMEMLVNNNIKLLWNFTSIRFDVPSDIIIEHTGLNQHLAVLSYAAKLSKK